MIDANMAGMWPDTSLHFDTNENELRPCKGEVLVKVYENVEDQKGNSGDKPGSLHLSNLRLIWRSKEKKKTNIILGLGKITKISSSSTVSRLGKPVISLVIMAKETATFEFIFTMDSQDSSVVSDVERMLDAYKESVMYRTLKARSTVLTQDRELILLEGEQIFNKVVGAWNLSSDNVRNLCMLIGNFTCMHAHKHE